MSSISSTNFFHNCDRFMELKIFINSKDTELVNYYYQAADKHNAKMHSSVFPDAGFDLVTPIEVCCRAGVTNKINFLVKSSARMVCENGKVFNTGFHMCPRSSLSGTPLRLANSIGIIDSGYRGDLLGKFDCVSSGSGFSGLSEYVVSPYDRLLQIVAPGMVPIYVTVVETENELGVETERGDGGFGSTGK